MRALVWCGVCVCGVVCVWCGVWGVCGVCGVYGVVWCSRGLG